MSRLPLIALVSLTGLVALGLVLSRAAADQPPQERDIPGGSPIGRLETRWIAPYVLSQTTWVNGGGGAHTTWYGEDGSIERELPHSGGGFVSVGDDDGWTVYGVLADWTVRLAHVPPEENGNLYAGISGDGHTFFRQRRQADGISFAEVWVDGVSAGRTTPLVAWGGGSFQVSHDGSLAIIAAGGAGPAGEPRGAEDKAPARHVTVFAPGAKPSFEAALPDGAWIEAVAPAGLGVIVRSPRGGREPDTMLFVSAHAARPLDLGVAPHVETWVPGTARAIVACGIGADERLRLIDCTTGTIVWDVADQAGHGHRSAPGVTSEGGLVLVSGLAPVAVDEVTIWTRRVDALDLATGARVAVWHSDCWGPVGFDEAAHFARRDGRLYLVARDAFSPVPLADIRAKENGWE